MARKKYEVGQVFGGIKIKEELPPNPYNHTIRGIKKTRKFLLEYPDGHEEIVLITNIKTKIYSFLIDND